jgi:mannan endo-1,4-beta-mannosidase
VWVRLPRPSLRIRLLVLGIVASLSVVLLVAPPGFGQTSRDFGGPEMLASQAGQVLGALGRALDTAPPRSSAGVHSVDTRRPTGKPRAPAGTAPTRTPTPRSAPPVQAGDASSAFVGRSGTQLMLQGQSYRFTGINIYMAASGGSASSCGGELYPNVGVPLSNMPSGIVFRFWAFQRFFESGGWFNWTSFDQVLAIAAAHGDKVIPVLANQHSYCDGPAKDLPWYQNGYRTTVEAGDIVTFRQYVSDVVARYADNPTVTMWQLVNEGQAVNADGTCTEPAALSALLAFSNDVGGVVHGIDHNHLVSEGTLAGWNGSGIGQWCGAANGDYQRLMASPGTDVCDFHDYGYPADPMGDPLAPDLASAIQMCHADDKPIMVAETGIYATSASALAGRATDFKAKFVGQFQAGVVGEVMWAWAVDPHYTTPAADPDYGISPGDPSLGVLGTF